MKKIFICLSLLMLTSCSSTTNEAAPTCSPLQGKFDMRFFEASGECGPIANSIIDFEYSGGTEDCAITKDTISDSKCDYDLTFTCPSSKTYHSNIKSHVTLSQDGESGYGTMTLSLFFNDDGTILCTSEYNVTFKRHAN
jgi:hypothetical protein